MNALLAFAENAMRAPEKAPRLFCFFFGIIFFLSPACNKNSTGPGNNPPFITSISASKSVVSQGDTVTITAVYSDIDGDSLTTKWTATGGILTTAGIISAIWRAPDTSGVFVIRLRIDDRKGGVTSDSVVLSISNQKPVITSLSASVSSVFVGQTITIQGTASDPEGHRLSYVWIVSAGEIMGSANTNAISWKAPELPAAVEITLTVSDAQGEQVSKSITLNVYGELGAIWIADTFNDRVVKMSPTGAILLAIGGFKNPRNLAVNPETREVWVADTDNNRVVKLGPDGLQLAEYRGLKEPWAVDLYAFMGTIWVAQNSDSNQVIQLSGSSPNDSLNIVKRVSGISNPRALAVDQVSGEVWVADTGNDRIVRLKTPQAQNFPAQLAINTVSGQFHETYQDFKRPAALDIYDTDHSCWIADRLNGRVVKITIGGSSFAITGFREPADIAVNSRDGSVWIADPILQKVIKLFRDIRVPPSYSIIGDRGWHLEISNYSQPAAVAVNDISVNENEWTVWFADELRLVKADDQGNVILSISGFDAPNDLRINPGQ